MRTLLYLACLAFASQAQAAYIFPGSATLSYHDPATAITWRTSLPVTGKMFHYESYGAGEALAIFPLEVRHQSRLLYRHPGGFVQWQGPAESIVAGDLLVTLRGPLQYLVFADPPVIDEPLLLWLPSARPWRLESIGRVSVPEPSAWFLALLALPLLVLRRVA